MFDGMIKEILDQVGELSSQNTELCALLRNVLQVQLLLCAFFSRILKSFSPNQHFDNILLSISGNGAGH